MITLSLIIPVYNVKPYLQECLESIICQKQSTIEIILIDDGSTDGSSAICETYATQYDCIRWIQQPNSGQSVARNTGLSLATGDYVWFVDSDDRITEHALSILLNQLNASTVDILGFSFENEVEGQIKSSDLNHFETIAPCHPNEFLKQTHYFFTSPWVRVFRRAFLEHYAIQFKEEIVHEDDFFNYQCMNYAQTVQKIPEVLYYYRIRSNSTTTSVHFAVIQKRIQSLFFVIEHLSEFSNLDKIYLENRKLAYQNFILSIAEKYCKTRASFRLKVKLMALVKHKIPKVAITRADFHHSKTVWLKKKIYNISTLLYCVYLELLRFRYHEN